MIIVERQLSNFSAISWREQVNFDFDDDELIVHLTSPTLYIFIYGTIESVVLSLIVGAFNHTKSHN